MSRSCRYLGRVLGAVLVVLTAAGTLWTAAGASARATAAGAPNVLFMSSSSPGFGWTEAMLAGIKEELAAQRRSVNVHFEFLDRVRFPNTPSDTEWAAFLAIKYREAPPDAIIADAAAAIQFSAVFGPGLFGGAPLIGILPRFEGLGELAKAVTVKVTTGPHIARTVEMALAHWPATQKIVIISDNRVQSHHLAEVITAAVAEHGGRKLEVEHLFDFRLEDLERRVAALPSHSVILYTHVALDNTGRYFNSDDVVARLALVATAPIYVLFDPDIGNGAVGGVVNNPRVAGRAAIRAALEAMAHDGQPMGQSENPYSSQMVVDWRQVQRWGISEDRIPPDAEVRYREPSLFEAHYREVLLALVFIGVLSVTLAVISALYVQRGRLAHALRETNSRLEERVAARTHDLAATSAQMRALIEFSPVPALITEHGRVRLANRRFIALFGCTLAEVADFEHWWSHAHPDPSYWAALQAEWQARVNQASNLGVPIEPMNADVLCHDGMVRNIQIHAVPLEDCLVIQFIDLTERKRMEEELRHIAFHDSLTRLPNRRLLLDRLKHALHTSKRQNSHLAVLFLDLNRFKQLNDTHGHDVGDLLLIEVGHRLHRAVRDSDTVARIGGDEFVVLLEGIGATLHQASLHAETVVAKIRQSLSEEYVLGTIRHHGSASIGIKIVLGDEGDPDRILKEADAAMYDAKRWSQQTGVA